MSPTPPNLECGNLTRINECCASTKHIEVSFPFPVDSTPTTHRENTSTHADLSQKIFRSQTFPGVRSTNQIPVWKLRCGAQKRFVRFVSRETLDPRLWREVDTFHWGKNNGIELKFAAFTIKWWCAHDRRFTIGSTTLYQRFTVESPILDHGRKRKSGSSSDTETTANIHVENRQIPYCLVYKTHFFAPKMNIKRKVHLIHEYEFSLFLSARVRALKTCSTC